MKFIHSVYSGSNVMLVCLCVCMMGSQWMWCESDPFTLYLTLFAYSWINNKNLGWLHLGMLVCIPRCNFLCNLAMFHFITALYILFSHLMHFHFWINCVSNFEDFWSDATNLHKNIYFHIFFFQSAGIYCTTVSFYQIIFSGYWMFNRTSFHFWC